MTYLKAFFVFVILINNLLAQNKLESRSTSTDVKEVLEDSFKAISEINNQINCNTRKSKNCLLEILNKEQLKKYSELRMEIQAINNPKKINKRKIEDTDIYVGPIYGNIQKMIKPLLYSGVASIDYNNPLIFYNIVENRSISCNEIREKMKKDKKYFEKNIVFIPNLQLYKSENHVFYQGNYFKTKRDSQKTKNKSASEDVHVGEYQPESFFSLIYLLKQQKHWDEGESPIHSLLGREDINIYQFPGVNRTMVGSNEVMNPFLRKNVSKLIGSGLEKKSLKLIDSDGVQVFGFNNWVSRPFVQNLRRHMDRIEYPSKSDQYLHNSEKKILKFIDDYNSLFYSYKHSKKKKKELRKELGLGNDEVLNPEKIDRRIQKLEAKIKEIKNSEDVKFLKEKKKILEEQQRNHRFKFRYSFDKLYTDLKKKKMDCKSSKRKKKDFCKKHIEIFDKVKALRKEILFGTQKNPKEKPKKKSDEELKKDMEDLVKYIENVSDKTKNKELKEQFNQYIRKGNKGVEKLVKSISSSDEIDKTSSESDELLKGDYKELDDKLKLEKRKKELVDLEKTMQNIKMDLEKNSDAYTSSLHRLPKIANRMLADYPLLPPFREESAPKRLVLGIKGESKTSEVVNINSVLQDMVP